MIKATTRSICSGIDGCQVELCGSGSELLKEYRGIAVAMYGLLRTHLPVDAAKKDPDADYD